MEFSYVQPQKGSEMVLEQIRERIISGDLPPGSKLSSVVDLAANFGVGRSTVREALSALKAMGWIQIRQGGGTYVSTELPNEADDMNSNSGFNSLFQHAESIKEILEVRKVLETGCASLAAENCSEEDIAALESILLQMEKNLAVDEEGEKADVLFHLQIAKATQNALLINMMQSLSERMQETMKESRKLWFYGEHASARRLLQEHTEIVAAIKARDESSAGDRMLQHISKVEKVLFSLGKDTEKVQRTSE